MQDVGEDPAPPARRAKRARREQPARPAAGEALAAPEAYRQLGLLDERRWLQDLPPATRGGTRTTA